MKFKEMAKNIDINIPSGMIPSFESSNIFEGLPYAPKPLVDSSIKSQAPRSVLVLGNGFDLDLGLNTSYENFVNSDYWPFNRSVFYDKGSLPHFLNNHLGKIGTWYDLEEALAGFASQCIHPEDYLIEKDKAFFKTLIQKLKEYIQSQEDSFVDIMERDRHTKRMTPAHYVLSKFLQKEIRSIYTFNYTNLYRIANKLIIGFDDDFTHIHGSLAKDNIILGTGEQRNLDDNYFDFYKSASPYYESNNLVEDLNSADEVYIFGHSLGLNDHDYFSDFFKMASTNVHRPFHSGKLKVRIFTLDDKSEMKIKKQLMCLTEKHLTGLYAHCDFEILKTSNTYQADWMCSKSIF